MQKGCKKEEENTATDPLYVSASTPPTLLITMYAAYSLTIYTTRFISQYHNDRDGFIFLIQK
jgi:hypothetical protein